VLPLAQTSVLPLLDEVRLRVDALIYRGLLLKRRSLSYLTAERMAILLSAKAVTQTTVSSQLSRKYLSDGTAHDEQ
jgi:hypothetical protein